MIKQKKLAARLYDAIFPPSPKQTSRTYAAARVSRLNAGWTSQPTGANYERRGSLPQLIARSREGARDYLHIVNYLRLMRSNVIGQNGIQLQARARGIDGKTLNVALNKKIEELWWQWSHSETCTASGKLDWKGVQDLAVTQCERDGAFLIEMIEADNDFGFSLRTWDVTWLDFTFETILPGGNRVVMSVELDDNDKPVAYWLTTPQSESTFTALRNPTRRRRRVPAEQIIHGMLIHDDESAVHGVPGTAAALLPAKNSYSYTESQIMAARVGVNQFAVLETLSPDGEGPYTGGETSDGTERHPYIDTSPLSITELLPGRKLNFIKPEHPTQNHPEFKERLDLDIATALGVPMFLLMGNWKAVNFSSSRGGLGEFRERCKDYQKFISTTLCRRVFHEWLRIGFFNGSIKITAKEYKELQNPMWQARGFDYIDPSKDIDSDVTKLQNRLATPSEILAERGVDYVDFLERWQSDVKMAATYGVEIEEIYVPKQIAAAPPEAEPNDTNDPPPDETKPGKRAYTNGQIHDDESGQLN